MNSQIYVSWLGMDWRRKARPGPVRHGKARHGKARHGVVYGVKAEGEVNRCNE